MAPRTARAGGRPAACAAYFSAPAAPPRGVAGSGSSGAGLRSEIAQGRQDRLDLLGEIGGGKPPVPLGPPWPVPDVQPMLRQRANTSWTPAACSSTMRRTRLPTAASCSAAVMPAGSRRRRPTALLAQPGHPHQEKLVEIRVDDGQELQPLQQGQFLVQPFAQHAVVELQPAQLAVDIQLGRLQRVLGHGTGLYHAARFTDNGRPMGVTPGLAISRRNGRYPGPGAHCDGTRHRAGAVGSGRNDP